MENFYTSRYALISNGVVEEIIIVDSDFTAQRINNIKGYEQSVCVDQYFVVPGDIYENGVFIHEGNEVERQLTLEEKTANHDLRVSDLETLVLQLGGVI